MMGKHGQYSRSYLTMADYKDPTDVTYKLMSFARYITYDEDDSKLVKAVV
jgi:hypothetical protein